MSVIQAYRFALEPTPGQADALRSHCGGQRKAFNWGLARVKANLAQREAERSYRVPSEELTPLLNWSAYNLRKVGLQPP
jgi:putative transposase